MLIGRAMKDDYDYDEDEYNEYEEFEAIEE